MIVFDDNLEIQIS